MYKKAMDSSPSTGRGSLNSRAVFENNKKIAYYALFSFFISTILVAGRSLDLYSDISISKETILGIVLCALFVFAVIQLFRIISKYVTKSRVIYTLGARGFFGKATTPEIIAASILILSVQLLVFLAAFPGVYGYDGPYHIWQVIHSSDANVTLNTGYSVIYSLYLSFFVNLGLAAGCVEYGFAAAMLIQAIIGCGISIYVCVLINKKLRNRVLFWMATLFYSNPFFHILMVSSSQDVFFGYFFLLATIFLFKLQSNRVDSKPSTIIIVKFVITALLMMLMRNNGMYAYIVLLLVSILTYIGKRKFNLIRISALILPFILYLMISGPFFSVMGITDPGTGIREMLSIPSQQLARSYANHPERFTESQKSSLFKFYSWDGGHPWGKEDYSWYWSQCEIADVAKARLDIAYTKDHLAEYIKLYIGVFLNNPGDYIKAFALNTLGFWYPLKNYPDARMYHPYIEYKMLDAKAYNSDYLEIKRLSIMPKLNSYLENWLYTGQWQNNIFTNLSKAGFWVAASIFLLCNTVAKKDIKAIRVLSLTLGLIITYFLSPVCLFRYVFPLEMVFPILLIIATKFPIYHAEMQ